MSGYLGNTGTMEIHDLSNRNTNCQIGEIKKKKSFDSLEGALDSGFDPCHYCILPRLKYEPVGEDLLSQAPALQEGYESVTPTLARVFHEGKLEMLFVHGNSRIKVLLGNTDVGDEHSPERLWRIWSAPLNPSKRNQITKPYSTGGSNQYFVDTATPQKGVWIDVPGQKLSSRPRGERVLMEFMCGIDGERRAGGMHYVVILDMTPTQYRVRLFKEKELPAEEWKKRLSPEGRAGLKAQTAPEAKGSLAVSSGWLDYVEDAARLPAAIPQ